MTKNHQSLTALHHLKIWPGYVTNVQRHHHVLKLIYDRVKLFAFESDVFLVFLLMVFCCCFNRMFIFGLMEWVIIITGPVSASKALKSYGGLAEFRVVDRGQIDNVNMNHVYCIEHMYAFDWPILLKLNVSCEIKYS